MTPLDKYLRECSERANAACDDEVNSDTKWLDFLDHAQVDILTLVAMLTEATKALELTKLHYQHSMHDHNWAYYINKKHSETLQRLNEMAGSEGE